MLKNFNGSSANPKDSMNKIASEASIKTRKDKIDGGNTKTLQ